MPSTSPALHTVTDDEADLITWLAVHGWENAPAVQIYTARRRTYALRRTDGTAHLVTTTGELLVAHGGMVFLAPPAAPDLPYWIDDDLIDDDLIDHDAHGLVLDVAQVASAEHGFDVYEATCACGGWRSRGLWDQQAQYEAYDGHMHDVQRAARTIRQEAS